MVCPDMVAVLLDQHGDPNLRTVDGVTPLDIHPTLTSDFSSRAPCRARRTSSPTSSGSSSSSCSRGGHGHVSQGRVHHGGAAPMYGELLGSTVGSYWDRPSALLPINRRLDHL
jgi:regulatory protein NPR1